MHLGLFVASGNILMPRKKSCEHRYKALYTTAPQHIAELPSKAPV